MKIFPFLDTIQYCQYWLWLFKVQRVSAATSHRVSTIASKKVSKIASRIHSQVQSRIQSRIHSRYVSRIQSRPSSPPQLRKGSTQQGALATLSSTGQILKPILKAAAEGRTPLALKSNPNPSLKSASNSSTQSNFSTDTYDETRDVFQGKSNFLTQDLQNRALCVQSETS